MPAPFTKAQLTTEIGTNWPDNNTGAITPALLRSTVLDLLNSYGGLADVNAFSAANSFNAGITVTTSFTATNLVTNASLAQMNANTIKGNNTGSTANAADLTVAQVQTLTLGAIQLGKLVTANFNSTADQSITITNPSATGYIIDFIIVTNASVSLTTAAGGIYTGAAKSGLAVVAAATTYNTITSTTVNTAANATNIRSTFNWLNSATLFFALTTPQGSAATADIYVFGRPLY